MSFEFHSDWQRYFNQQVDNSKEYVLPFIERVKKIEPGLRVMEIGCGEGGVLKPFFERGCEVTGVDLSPDRIENAKTFFKEEMTTGRINFIAKNIYDLDFEKEFGKYFDIIILKDSIEHIPEQEKLIGYLKKLLKLDGVIFFGFPPWYMPFGGHQQICKNRILSLMPYYHLLPKFLYRPILKLFGENEGIVQELMEIKDTGISIERFERIVLETGYKVVAKNHFLINPIYKYKFGLNARNQFGFIRSIPFLRNFLTTCVYYLIQEK